MSSHHALRRNVEIRPASEAEAEAEVEAKTQADVDVVHRTITVQSIKRFAGLHQVTWRDGGRKHRILVAIEHWASADQTVRNAVAETYSAVDRPTVFVPPRSWR